MVLNATVKGEISAKDTLIVGERGCVEATVRAETVVVCGRVVGDVVASERVELKKGGACLVEFEGKPRAGRGRLAWAIPPGILRDLAG